MFLLKSFTNKKVLWWLLFGLIVFAWWKFRLGFLTPRSGDTWIYWYAGKEILEGSIPYRDFFYSSPPLIPYLTALWQLFFGFHLKVALLIPHALTIISASLIFTFFSLRKQFQAGLLAAIAFLFTGAVFSHADFLLGSTILTPFIILAFIFFDRKKFLLSGVFFGLAALTKIYGIVPAVPLIFLLGKEIKNLRNFLLGIFISFGVPNLIFWVLIGNEYLDLIFFNHFKKPTLERYPEFLALLKYDLALVIALLSGIWLQKKDTLLRPTVFASAIILLFFGFVNEVFYSYFQPLIAILAILFGYLLAEKNRFVKKFILPLILGALVFNSLFSVWAYYKHDFIFASIPNFEKMVEIVQTETKSDDPIYGIGTLAPLLALETNRQLFGSNFDNLAKWNALEIFSIEDQAKKLKQARVPLVISEEDNVKSNQIYSQGELLPKKFLSKNCRIISKFGWNEFTFWKCFDQ
jgi:hypothetical protein